MSSIPDEGVWAHVRNLEQRIAELERREALLERENAVLNRLMHATRDLDICGIRGVKGRCQGCDAQYAKAVAAVIEEWPPLHNAWVKALTDAGFPWTDETS